MGRHVVSQALDTGHHVTAYARNPAMLNLTQPNLTVIAGELSGREAVGRAVAGADAVISALGPSPDRKATAMPRVEGTPTILDAMRAADVGRYIGMATPSLRDARDTKSLLGRLAPVMGRRGLPRAYRELLDVEHEACPTAPIRRPLESGLTRLGHSVPTGSAATAAELAAGHAGYRSSSRLAMQ